MRVEFIFWLFGSCGCLFCFFRHGFIGQTTCKRFKPMNPITTCKRVKPMDPIEIERKLVALNAIRKYSQYIRGKYNQRKLANMVANTATFIYLFFLNLF